MTRAGTTHDISIQNPGGSEIGLMLAKDEQGRALWSRKTASILPSGAPPGAIKSENFDPQVRVEYTIRGADLGVGFKHHVEGGRIAGLVKGVDTRFDGFFCGPKIRYIGDAELASNAGFETWAAGLPTSWTKISGTETVAQEITIVHGGGNSAKVTSGAAGDGLRQTFTASYFRQARVRLRCWVYVPTGEGDPTIGIYTSTPSIEKVPTTKDAWTQVDIYIDLTTTVLTYFRVDLKPATNDFAYFDDVQLTFEHLVGPPGPFTELEISSVKRTFHASGRTVFRLNTATEGFEAWDSASAAVNITDLITHGTTMYRALGASNLWELSTDGITWTANARAGDDRYANRFAVTWSLFGSLLLWKSLLPNKLAVTATPDAGTWTTYEIGAADTDIIDLLVSENFLYIIKEDGVYTIDYVTGESILLTPEWATLRYSRQGFGGAPWTTGKAYIPSGRAALWEFDPASNTRRQMHPAAFGSEASEYSGKPTRVIGDGSWLYVFLQEPAETPETCHLMAGKPAGAGFRYGHQGEIDAGRVEFAWITATQFVGPRLYWSSRDIDTTATGSVSVVKDAALGLNRNIGNTDWISPANIYASDDARASCAPTGDSAGHNNPATAASSGAGTAWTNPNNCFTSNDTRASVDTAAIDADTQHLQATNFSFSVPAGATILGVEVKVEGSQSPRQNQPAYFKLIKGGSETGTQKSDTAWTTTESIFTYGGAADLWGATLTPSDVNASNFGVAVWMRNTETNPLLPAQFYYVDHVTIKVYFSSPTANSDFLDATEFGFAIPSTATIDGIKVTYERSQAASGAVKDVTVQLLKAGSAVGDNKADTSLTWPTADTDKEYGGATDLWGTTWTPAQVNATNFGVTLKVEGNGGVDTARVDRVKIRVYYTPPGGSELNNRLGWIRLPTTENPRFCDCGEFATGVTLRTGVINRFPGWKTAFQEITIKSSLSDGERLGSSGRQITAKFNAFDGNGFLEVGGSGNGVFNTSPSQTRYFKTASDTDGVVAEDLELELTFATTDDDTTPVVDEINLAGTVRPVSVDVFEFTILASEDQQALGGQDVTKRSTIVDALRTMRTPAWTTTLRDRDGAAHQVYIFPDEGYEEVDILQWPGQDDKPEVVKAFKIRCFEVPGSSSWPS